MPAPSPFLSAFFCVFSLLFVSGQSAAAGDSWMIKPSIESSLSFEKLMNLEAPSMASGVRCKSRQLGNKNSVVLMECADGQLPDFSRFAEDALIERVRSVESYESAAIEPQDRVPGVERNNLKLINWFAAQKEWRRLAGPSPERIAIGVVDGTIDRGHPDIAGVLWQNSGEIPDDGLDNDENGYVDDVIGWNAWSHSGKLFPPSEHGTHVAGIIAASSENLLGVDGVFDRVELVNVNIGPVTRSNTANIFEAIQYLIALREQFIRSEGRQGANIRVINASFGVPGVVCGEEEFPVLLPMLDALERLGIWLVTAVPNQGMDLDVANDFPATCPQPLVVAVTATDSEGELRSKKVLVDGVAQKVPAAAWGKRTVDVAAPGESIESLAVGGLTRVLSGTSMAAPHVSAALAMRLSIPFAVPPCFSLALEQLWSARTPRASLFGRTRAGGVLDLFQWLLPNESTNFNCQSDRSKGIQSRPEAFMDSLE